ncbi:MAG: pyridoxal-phosphate dependent enzyme [Candidatus Eisenbacteria sp.]|nr:pyridoxal-phosphate dependent enzyme [Candidatus Eisenbacteria bacterium]
MIVSVNPVTFSDVQTAAQRIAPYAHRTPVITSASLDRAAGAKLFFKCENFQRVGAFKFRGACNAIFSLSESEARRGVLTHSSGNHGAAVALNARLRGIPAIVVMPENSVAVKRAAVADYGARIVSCDATLAARDAVSAKILAETGATLIHSYDNDVIIAGQGTAALELMQEVPQLDLVLAPVGGGGLLSGTALAVHGVSSKARIIAAEPAGADDAFRSLRDGRIHSQTDPQTIADGLRTALSERTFAVIREHVSEILLVEDEATINAMRYVWERMKIVIEASAAVPVAAILAGRVDVRNLRVGVILSGGNVDLDHLPWSA